MYIDRPPFHVTRHPLPCRIATREGKKRYLLAWRNSSRPSCHDRRTIGRSGSRDRWRNSRQPRPQPFFGKCSRCTLPPSPCTETERYFLPVRGGELLSTEGVQFWLRTWLRGSKLNLYLYVSGMRSLWSALLRGYKFIVWSNFRFNLIFKNNLARIYYCARIL